MLSCHWSLPYGCPIKLPLTASGNCQYPISQYFPISPRLLKKMPVLNSIEFSSMAEEERERKDDCKSREVEKSSRKCIKRDREQPERERDCCIAVFYSTKLQVDCPPSSSNHLLRNMSTSLPFNAELPHTLYFPRTSHERWVYTTHYDRPPFIPPFDFPIPPPRSSHPLHLPSLLSSKHIL